MIQYFVCELSWTPLRTSCRGFPLTVDGSSTGPLQRAMLTFHCSLQVQIMVFLVQTDVLRSSTDYLIPSWKSHGVTPACPVGSRKSTILTSSRPEDPYTKARNTHSSDSLLTGHTRVDNGSLWPWPPLFSMRLTAISAPY